MDQNSASESKVVEYTKDLEILCGRQIEPNELAEALRKLCVVCGAIEPKLNNETTTKKETEFSSSPVKQDHLSRTRELLIGLSKQKLNQLLVSEKGEMRKLTVKCEGRDDNGFLVWTLINTSKAFVPDA